MSGIQRYEPWPQEWPMEDANGDLVTYEDHVKVVEELAEALRITREKLLSIAHSEFDGVWSDQDFLNEVAEADAALAKVKEQQA